MNAEALYLSSPLMGFQLVDRVYIPIPSGVDNGIHSDVLGLDFHIRERRLQIYDPVDGQWLQTPAETAEARAEQEATRAETAEAHAEREAIARQQAEEEVKRLREQLARAQAHT